MNQEASVLGLGTMGSTLARLLLRAGYRVTVWNRTHEKAEALVQIGADAAATAAAAVAASPVVVVCVHDYKAANAILGTDEVASVLADRVLVQLTTGSHPRGARERDVGGPAWRHRAVRCRARGKVRRSVTPPAITREMTPGSRVPSCPAAP